jgi:hypothetical protein
MSYSLRSGGSVKITSAIAIAVSVVAVVAVIGGPPASAATPSGPVRAAVTIDSHGWVHYNNVAANSLRLANRKTVTISGKIDSAGTCSMTETGSASPDTAGAYSEEIAVNSSTCQEQLVVGTLTPADLASLNAQSNGALVASGTTISATAARNAAGAAATPNTGVRPASIAPTTSSGAYEKTAYIDPAYLTITSLSANLTWAHNGSRVPNASYRIVPYEFKYDGWSTSGTPHPPFAFAAGKVSIQANETFRNNDFEALLLSVSAAFPGGPAYVFAACGFSISTAVFNLRNYIQGNANGSYNWSYNDTTSGGCSDLVRHRHWSAYGSSN